MGNGELVKYFEHNAADYNRACEKESPGVRSFIFSERKKIVLSMFDVKKGKVLDIGCGPGAYEEDLSETGLEIYGVDPSEEMVRIANSKNLLNSRFSAGSIEKLGFEENFFDGVLCIGVLEYLDKIKAGIKETARVVRKGGVAIFTVPNGSSILNKGDMLLRKISRKIYALTGLRLLGRDIDHRYAYNMISKKELDAILEKNGLCVEDYRFHIFRLSFLNKICPGMSLYISKKMNFISNPLLAANYIVKCRKS